MQPNPYFDEGHYWWHDETFLRHGPYATEEQALRHLLRYTDSLNPTKFQRIRAFLHAALAKFL